MLIVLLDEPGLFVYPSPEAAQIDLEPPDAESTIRAAFDEHGVPYRVEWIRPNRTGAFGFVSFGQGGCWSARSSRVDSTDRTASVTILQTRLDWPNFS